MRLLPDGSIEFSADELGAVLAARGLAPAKAPAPMPAPLPAPMPAVSQAQDTALARATRGGAARRPVAGAGFMSPGLAHKHLAAALVNPEPEAEEVEEEVDPSEALRAYVNTPERAERLTVLGQLKLHGEIGMDALLTASGVATPASVSGVMSGVTKLAKRLGIERENIVLSGRDASGAMYYAAGPLLLSTSLE